MTGGSGPANLEAEHALDVVVLTALIGLVLGLRRGASENIDDGAVGDVPPVPASDQHLVALQGKLLGHLAVLHFPGGVVVADALLRVAVEDYADVVATVGHDHAWFTVGDHAPPDLGRHVVVAANVVAVVVAHGFLQTCAALRGRMRHGGYWELDWVLRLSGTCRALKRYIWQVTVRLRWSKLSLL